MHMCLPAGALLTICPIERGLTGSRDNHDMSHGMKRPITSLNAQDLQLFTKELE